MNIDQDQVRDTITFLTTCADELIQGWQNGAALSSEVSRLVGAIAAIEDILIK